MSALALPLAAPRSSLIGLLARAAWLPWLVFTALLGTALWRATAKGTAYDGDDLMLILTLGALLWIERASIVSSLWADGCEWALSRSLLFFFGAFVLLAGRFSGAFSIELWGLFLLPAGLVASFALPVYLRSALFLAGASTVMVLIGRVGPMVLSADLAVTLAAASASLLSATVMPVISDGVRLYFGPYSAEVTEACAGMNSIFALTALAMLYLREGIQRSGWHIGLLVACVIPVAVLTNFLRIVLLVLSTQFIGDQFAQGVFHETAGIFAFVFSMMILAGIDWLALRICKRPAAPEAFDAEH